MKSFLIVFSCFVIALSSAVCFMDDDDSESKANVRFTNNTGSPLSNISGGGATWTGPYSNGTTTEQRAVSTGNVNVSWTCGVTNYSLIVKVESGNWRIIMNNCSATLVTTVQE